jgi:hypothetical protein
VVSVKRVTALLVTSLFVVGCVAGAPTSIPFYGSLGPEQELVGVVIGLWKLDTEKNRERLSRERSLTTAEVEGLADRAQVRVGLRRSVIWGQFSEVVVLPENWRFSTAAIVDDGVTVNVGDVVMIRGAKGRRIDFLDSIVRKCNAPPLPNEKWGFDLGCRQVDKFSERTGYGGQNYIFTVF